MSCMKLWANSRNNGVTVNVRGTFVVNAKTNIGQRYNSLKFFETVWMVIFTFDIKGRFVDARYHIGRFSLLLYTCLNDDQQILSSIKLLSPTFQRTSVPLPRFLANSTFSQVSPLTRNHELHACECKCHYRLVQMILA